MTRKTITAFVDNPSDWHTTGTVTPVGKITQAMILLISYSMSTKMDKKTAVSITNTTESPQPRKTHITEFSVVTPEKSEFVKPVDTAILSMIPEVLHI